MLSDWLTSVGGFVAILLFLVICHELGHFFTAKLAGVKVLEFGIGYPPRIWGKRFGDTEYTINALPLGGFVRMLGETDAQEVDTSDQGRRMGVMNTGATVRGGEDDPRTLAAKPHRVRILVLASGAIVNAILPILLFTIYFMVPQQVPVGLAQITHVSPDTPAAAAGLQANDIIMSIDGDKVNSLNDAANFIQLHQGQTMKWVIKRKNPLTNVDQLMTVSVYARFAVPTEIDTDGSRVKQGPTGIRLSQVGDFTNSVSYPIWRAFPKALGQTRDTLILMKNQIFSWIGLQAFDDGAPTGAIGRAPCTNTIFGSVFTSSRPSCARVGTPD